MAIVGGVRKGLNLHSRGVAINGRLVKCPRHIFASILEVFSSSSLNNTIIGTTFSYLNSVFDSKISIFMRSFI